MTNTTTRLPLAILGLGACLLPPLAMAQDQSIVPDRGFYLGLGGSLNGIDYGEQDVYAKGTSDIFEDGVLTASGEADGPGDFTLGDESSFAPNVQAGTFRRIDGGDWLWGGKFSYAYLDSSSTRDRIVLPQVGSFTFTESGETDPFIGNAVAKSYTTSVEHQFTLMPYVGRAFERSFVYLGAGPTLSRTRTEIDDLVGFADINGNRQDISGAPQDFSDSEWVFGGAATVGMTYFFDPSWFLDVSYTYARGQTQESDYSGTFQSESPTGLVNEGTLEGSSSGRIINQSVQFTINKVF